MLNKQGLQYNNSFMFGMTLMFTEKVSMRFWRLIRWRRYRDEACCSLWLYEYIVCPRVVWSVYLSYLCWLMLINSRNKNNIVSASRRPDTEDSCGQTSRSAKIRAYIISCSLSWWFIYYWNHCKVNSGGCVPYRKVKGIWQVYFKPELMSKGGGHRLSSGSGSPLLNPDFIDTR